MNIRNVPTKPVFALALQNLEPTLTALPRGELLPIRHDIGEATFFVLGMAADIARHREEVRVEVGEDFARKIDALPDAARAASAAHTLYLTTLHGGDTAAMIDELSRERRVLLAEAHSLVARGKLSETRLRELAGGTSQKDLCLDVLQLAGAFRSEWPSISSSTPVTMAELDRADALANAVVTALGQMEHASSRGSDAGERRQRAYTYFVSTYDDVRRAIAYVRWDEGDADEIAPSLSAGRKAHRADDGVDDVMPGAPIVAVTPAMPVTTVTPGAPAAPTPGAPSSDPFVTPS